MQIRTFENKCKRKRREFRFSPSHLPEAEQESEIYDEATYRMQEWFLRHDRASRWICIGVVIAAAIVMVGGWMPR